MALVRDNWLLGWFTAGNESEISRCETDPLAGPTKPNSIAATMRTLHKSKPNRVLNGSDIVTIAAMNEF